VIWLRIYAMQQSIHYTVSLFRYRGVAWQINVLGSCALVASLRKPYRL
jgi:hypothetical protein